MRSPLLLQLLLLLLPFNVLGQAKDQPAKKIVKQTARQESKPLYAGDLNSKVTGTQVTYNELIRRVIPDLQIDSNDADVAIAHKTIAFKHLSENTEAAPLEGDIKLDSFQPYWINSDGRRVLLLELDLSSEAANEGTNYEGEADIVAAFIVQPAIKLLDIMDVKTDRFSGFWERPAVLQLTPQSDAFLVSSSHFNSGENYNDLTVLFLNHDRFETITNIFLFDTQGCGATFTETPSFRVLPGNTKYPNILLTVNVKKDADSQECDRRTRGYTTTYQALYQWNAAKGEYRTTSRQLDALDKFNRNRL